MCYIMFVCYYFYDSIIFFLPFAARPAFYKYVIVMFILNAIALFACGLTGNGAAFGFWLDSSIAWQNSNCFELPSFLKLCVYFCSQVLSCHCCVLPCLLSSTALYYISGRLFSGYNVLYSMASFCFFTFVVRTSWLIVLLLITGGRFSHGECVLLWNERCWFLRIRLGVMWY